MFATFENRGPHELAGEPAFRQGYALRRLGDDRSITLALWSDRRDPMAYTVEYDRPGPAADQPAAVAMLAWFDGPQSPARVAAARFANEHRVVPALAAQPGLVRVLAFWRERDAAACALNLAVDLTALRDAGTAVNSTVLLPGEDPALLTGPDRVDIHHVDVSRQIHGRSRIEC